jgi:hypothetical protein
VHIFQAAKPLIVKSLHFLSVQKNTGNILIAAALSAISCPSEVATIAKQLEEENPIMKKTVARVTLTIMFLLALSSATALADGSLPEPTCPAKICPQFK